MELPGERIRARRKELKLTQRALAKIARVSHVTISQWETGDSEPGGKNLFALSKALQCSPTWILFGDENMSPEEPIELPRQLDERQQELLDLFDQLPESEQVKQLSSLRLVVDDCNKFFNEMLKKRKMKN